MRMLLLSLFPVFVVLCNLTHAQVHQYKKCNLGDPVFYENKVKYITDEELFGSIELSMRALSKVDGHVKRKEYKEAFEEWGVYFQKKEKPYFIWDNDRLMVTFQDVKDKLLKDSVFSAETDYKADMVLRNEINGAGTTVVKYDSIIDFNTEEFGNIGKYALNSFPWAQPLNYMYIKTGNENYIKKMEGIFNEWYAQRYRIQTAFPEITEIVFYELGLANRFSVFLPFYLHTPDQLKWITHERMLKTFLGMGRWYYEIEKKGGYTHGNWQPFSCAALIQLGLYFPEFKESDEWIEIGVQRILEHLKHDYFSDGGHSERSPGSYSIMTYYSLRNAYYLLKKFNSSHLNRESELASYFRKMIDWWVAMIPPNREIPPINDTHRIKFPEVFFLEKALLFNDSTNLGILKKLYNLSVNYPMPDFTSKNLDSSGFAVMRSGWEKDSYYSNLTYGKFGGWHTHDDLLSFEIHANGKAHIIDAAIGRTYDDTLFNKWYKTPQAHNTVSVILNDDDAKTMYDSTMDRMNHQGENIKWSTSGVLDYFSGQHRGYHKYGITHNRTVVFVKPYYWLIIDSIENSKKRNGWLWNLHAVDTIIREGNYYRTAGKNGIIIYPVSNYPSELDKGYAMLKNEKRDDDYQKISWLKFYGEADRAVTPIEVLIYPYKDEPQKIYFVEDSMGVKTVKHGEFTDEFYYGLGLQKSNITSDAELVFIRKKKDKVIAAKIINGSFLKCGDIKIKEKDKSDYEWILK